MTDRRRSLAFGPCTLATALALVLAAAALPAAGATTSSLNLGNLVLREVSADGDHVVLGAGGSRLATIASGEVRWFVAHCADGASFKLRLSAPAGGPGEPRAEPSDAALSRSDVEPPFVHQAISAGGASAGEPVPACRGVKVSYRIAGSRLAAGGGRALEVELSKAESYAALVKSPALQKQLLAIGLGSTVGVTLDQEAGKDPAVSRLQVHTVATRVGIEILAFLAAAGLLAGITAFLLQQVARQGVFRQLVLGKDNRYSGSKFQTALWFGLLMTTYLATLLLRLVASHGALLGGVSLPQNLLILSGLSAITFVGAKAAKVAHVNSAQARADEKAAQADATTAAALTARARADAATAVGLAAAPAGGMGAAPPMAPAAAVAEHQALIAESAAAAAAQAAQAALLRAATLTAPAQHASFPLDLVRGDASDADPGSGGIDFASYQMIVVVLIAAGTYFVQAWQFLASVPLQATIELPEVNPALLAVFGLGHGAYLIKKAVADGA